MLPLDKGYVNGEQIVMDGGEQFKGASEKRQVNNIRTLRGEGDRKKNPIPCNLLQ